MRISMDKLCALSVAIFMLMQSQMLPAESLADRRSDIPVEQWQVNDVEELINLLEPTAAGAMPGEMAEPMSEEEHRAMEQMMREMALPKHRQEWLRASDYKNNFFGSN